MQLTWSFLDLNVSIDKMFAAGNAFFRIHLSFEISLLFIIFGICHNVQNIIFFSNDFGI